LDEYAEKNTQVFMLNILDIHRKMRTYEYKKTPISTPKYENTKTKIRKYQNTQVFMLKIPEYEDKNTLIGGQKYEKRREIRISKYLC